MKYIYLIGGLIAFGLSFIIHHFYMQFIVLGIFLLVLFTIEKNSCDVSELKKVIEAHNELMKKDIEELKNK